MTTYLLDVNVLVALFDPSHPNHDAAHDWLSRKKRRWASCPITENGFIRVVSHPRYPSVRATAADLAQRLSSFCARSQHVAWPCDVSLLDASLFDLSRVSGPSELTDIYLLGLAVRHKGRLATFDRKITAATVSGASSTIELLP